MFRPLEGREPSWRRVLMEEGAREFRQLGGREPLPSPYQDYQLRVEEVFRDRREREPLSPHSLPDYIPLTMTWPPQGRGRR